MSQKRVFIIVLDSFGVGEAKDAAAFGDEGSSTIRSCSTSPYFKMPNMGKMGLFSIDGVEVIKPVKEAYDPVQKTGAYMRLAEVSCGKDTTTGHWEMAGIQSLVPLPTYPEGFPEEIIEEFKKQTGRGVLVNRPYSGTEVIRDYGDEHMRTGDLIVYTSADSVFQIAAHEEIVPVEQLYEYCKIARKILTGEHGVGRVIARPFIGHDGSFERTSRRHDFSLVPPDPNMLTRLREYGKNVLAVGKIRDIFAGAGIEEYVFTSGNAEGIDRTIEYMDKDFEGLCFTNLVDCDMIYGHRRDIDGYAAAMAAFDEKLPVIMEKLRPDDILMMTADHGCDPGFMKTTDHTREYVPLLLYGENILPGNYHTRDTFADISATVLSYLGVSASDIPGTPIPCFNSVGEIPHL